jgi:hypothetical protein
MLWYGTPWTPELKVQLPSPVGRSSGEWGVGMGETKIEMGEGRIKKGGWG